MPTGFKMFGQMKRIISLTLLALLSSNAFAGARHVRQDVAHTESDPKAQALKLYKVIKNQDWKAMYSLILFPSGVAKPTATSADEFAAGFRDGINQKDGGAAVNNLFNNMSDIAVGEPAVNGDKADVPTSATITINGKALVFKGVAHMKKDGDTWKWDLSFTEDLTAATEQELQALLGKPQ
jgi:hypothetical protein